MIEIVESTSQLTLNDYAAYLRLTGAVAALREGARVPAKQLKGRRVWMVNSTAQGGGVAEMLPKVLVLMRELGVDARWAVIAPEEAPFFALTKRLHNLIHGAGDPTLGDEEHALYRGVSERLADQFQQLLQPGDVVVIHDPQPAGMGAILAERTDLPFVWRCHIGLDETTRETEAAWSFLRPWLESYRKAVFTLPEYVLSFLEDRFVELPPAIDPLSHKNRPLEPHKIAGVLSNSGLAATTHPVLTPPFGAQAQRLQTDGSFLPASQGDDLGLLYRPYVFQVSRWDRLKGFVPLLEAFAHLKQVRAQHHTSERHRRRLALARLVLAGPDPASIQDDPEGLEVFEEICAGWQALPAELQLDVAVLSLPMRSRKENALMVNALQRCASVVVQNSLREGFGLTVTEAMWKGRPVLGSDAAGIRAQVIDGESGRLVPKGAPPPELAGTLDHMLENDKARGAWGRNAQRRVHDRYLVFAQVQRWLEVLSTV